MATNKPNEERRAQNDEQDAMKRQQGSQRPDPGRGPEEKRVAAPDGESAERSTRADRGTESWERRDEPGSKR